MTSNLNKFLSAEDCIVNYQHNVNFNVIRKLSYHIHVIGHISSSIVTFQTMNFHSYEQSSLQGENITSACHRGPYNLYTVIFTPVSHCF